MDLAGIEDDLKGIPRIITRKGWIPEASTECTTFNDKVSAIAVQSTGGSNDYSPEQVPAMLKSIYKYQTGQLGWCDVGSNAFIDKFGRIFEGRAGGLNKAVQGQHTPGFNANTWGISLMGDFSSTAPSENAVTAAGELAGWRAHVAGFSPSGTDTHFSEGNNKYPEGTPVNLPNVFASSTVTGLPATEVAGDIPAITRGAQTRYEAIKAGAFDAEASRSLEKFRDEQRKKAETKRLTDSLRTDPSGAASRYLGGLAGWDDNDGSSTMSKVDQKLADPSTQTVLKVAGSLLAIGATVAVSRGLVPDELQQVGNAELVSGVTVRDIPVMVTKLLSLGGDTKYSRTWQRIDATVGPALGKVLGGPTTATPVSALNSQITYVPFEHGLIVSSPEAGTHGIWGAIGDAWAAHGFDTVLGLPVNEEYAVDATTLRTDFQNGFITFDRTTGTTQVHLPGGDQLSVEHVLAALTGQTDQADTVNRLVGSSQ
nr:N-acetylmuramoyl-L-alanine amidase [Corynebacterium mendelii]